MNLLVRRTLEVARSRLGVREIGHSNTGVEVDAYLESVGDAPGNPWCAAFAYNNVLTAAEQLGVRNPYLRSGYCPDIGAWARHRGILFDTPRTGDNFLQLHGTDFHHTGHVTGVSGAAFSTVEGNTNSDGSREGYEVEAKTRQAGPRFAFVRWALLCGGLGGAVATRTLLLGGEKVGEVPVVANITLCPVRKWCAWMKLALSWDDGEEPPIIINGRRLAAQLSLIEGEAYAPLRALAEATGGLHVAFDEAKQTVEVTRVDGSGV